MNVVTLEGVEKLLIVIASRNLRLMRFLCTALGTIFFGTTITILLRPGENFTVKSSPRIVFTMRGAIVPLLAFSQEHPCRF